MSRSGYKKRTDESRDPGGFCALPFSVLDSPKFLALSHPAKALLLEFARQYSPTNNGRLIATSDYLNKRGWKSRDVINRAKKELIEQGFIHETVKGHRPNKASWYAVTWYRLERMPGYDAGAEETFRRGSYKAPTLVLVPAASKPSHEELFEKHRSKKAA